MAQVVGSGEVHANDWTKESPPPQESPGSSTTPDPDGEAKVKKARNTVILREVDPAATEDQILALFNKTDLKVISARVDVQNTWFVIMETEEAAKNAVLHSNQQTLLGMPVKARVKSETLRPSAVAWQPSPAARAQAMLLNASGYGAAAPFSAPIAGQGVTGYNNWSGTMPASISRPPAGGVFKRVGQSNDIAGVHEHGGGEGEGTHGAAMHDQEQQNVHGQPSTSRGQRRGSSSAGGRNQSERKGRKLTGQGSTPAAPKQPSFQPQDFPSLSGSDVAVPAAGNEILPSALPVQEAPANSWAARAKTIAEAPVAPAPKKKESPAAVTVTEKKDTKERKKEAAIETSVKADLPAASAVVENRETPSQGRTTPSDVQGTESPSSEVRRRGWEKPGLPQQKKESPQPQEAIQSSEVPVRAELPETNKDSAEKAEKSKKQSGKQRSQKEKAESNGHVEASPIVPLAWGTKSFAQVIKEKPAQAPLQTSVAVTQQPAKSVLGTLTALKSNENWADVEDEEPSQTASTHARQAVNRSPEDAEKPRLTSDSSNDWRKDAAARRKEEQTRSTGRKPNGTSS